MAFSPSVVQFYKSNETYNDEADQLYRTELTHFLKTFDAASSVYFSKGT